MQDTIIRLTLADRTRDSGADGIGKGYQSKKLKIEIVLVVRKRSLRCMGLGDPEYPETFTCHPGDDFIQRRKFILGKMAQPVHIAFLELIVDPACSIVFEAEREEAGIMQRPPRPASEHLFDRRMVTMSLLQGLGVLIALLAIFGIALYRGQSEEDARALTFTTLVIANIAMIIANRSWTRNIVEIVRTPNPATWWVAGSAFAFLALVLYVPFLRTLFHFSVLHPNDIALCLAAGATSVAWFEMLKALQHRRTQ